MLTYVSLKFCDVLETLFLFLYHSTFFMPFPVTVQVKVTLSPSFAVVFVGSIENEEMYFPVKESNQRLL